MLQAGAFPPLRPEPSGRSSLAFAQWLPALGRLGDQRSGRAPSAPQRQA